MEINVSRLLERGYVVTSVLKLFPGVTTITTTISYMHDLPGATFGHMCGQELKMHEVSFRDYFWSYVRPGGENAQNKLPGATVGRMCGQGLKMLKRSFLRQLLAICAARD